MTNLTKIEQKMLKRLEDECVLHWVVLGPEEVKALNRLVKKGVAIMTVGAVEVCLKYWRKPEF